ncbi:MAG: hypothetical protein OSB66_07790 [SAR202 cluster bacterium]|nr:hypothetical protein [SAR202 cluster bacterium]
MNGIKSPSKFIYNHGIRNDEEWPKGIRTDLMEEIPSNLIIPSQQRLDYEIATAFEMAMRGHVVFGPNMFEIENKSEWSEKYKEIWSG